MTPVKTGLSKKLLTRVLSVYFILTFIVTVGQIFTEYFSTKQNIEGELQTLKNTFSTSLTRAIWELNTPQALTIARGLMELPIVEGVQIRDETGEYIANLGNTADQPRQPINSGMMQDHPGGVFGYSFPLIFEFSGRASHVGDVTLYSSFDIIYSRIEIGIFFLIGNAIVKTAFLVFLFMTAFRRLLSEPLANITEQMSAFDAEHPKDSKISVFVEDDNELRRLQFSYNQVIDDLIASQNKLRGTQMKLERSYQQIDEQNLLLEQEVAKKTASLSQIMLDLEQQKDELIGNQRELRAEIENRQRVENELRKRNNELASSMDTLNQAKDQLLESERMATLGGLVAGITHDVNTPIGVSVTAASFLEDRLNKLQKQFEDKTLTAGQMESFLDESHQTTSLLMKNLQRACELIESFKQISVDQTSDAERKFNLGEYIDEVMQSLKPSFKHTTHKFNIECPDDLVIRCAPGVIAQIITNMVMNSLIHGFDGVHNGRVSLSVSVDGDDIIMDYRDNGKGLTEAQLDKLFDAFFTTRRSEGGSGLGTHIMYNLVTQALNGTITPTSAPGKGLSYHIRFPLRR